MSKLNTLFATVAALITALSYFLFSDDNSDYPESDHYSTKKGRFFNEVTERKIDRFALIADLWAMILNKEKISPSLVFPMTVPDFARFLQPSKRSNFIWFGHSSLLARVAGQTIFIDPVFADSVSPVPFLMTRFQAPPAPLEHLPPVDWILLSHNHYDHLDQKVIAFYQSQKTGFIVPLGVSVQLQKWGIAAERIHELDWWQSLKLGEIEITATPARHNTGRGLFDKNRTLWAGYVLKTPTEQFYYSGDSSWGNGSQFTQIAEKFGQFDIAFVENGQYHTTWRDNHLFPEETAEVANLLKPKRFMPIHWGAYALALHSWNEPVERSIPLIEEYGVAPLTPLQGQVFDSQTETEYWWK